MISFLRLPYRRASVLDHHPREIPVGLAALVLGLLLLFQLGLVLWACFAE